MRKACEQGLQNLGIAEHSFYYLHGPDPCVPFEDSLGELVKLKDEGKIKYSGISNVNLDQVKLAICRADITAVQNRCNLFCKEDVKSGLIEFCKIKDIQYVAYCPLGGFADHAALAKSNLFDDIAEKYCTSSYSISLAWLLFHQILPIPGINKLGQLGENFKSLGLRLDEEDILKIATFRDLYVSRHVEKI